VTVPQGGDGARAPAGAAGEVLPGEVLPGEVLPGEVLPGEVLPGEGSACGQRAAGAGGARWQRLSPRALVVRPLSDLVRLVPLLAGLLILHAQTGGGLIWGVIAAAAAVVTGLVHWATTRYLITPERVYLRRGLVTQKVMSVARDRVRTVDISAHLLHRMLGICRLSIGTGRNDLRGSESLHLDGLSLPVAEKLRAVLLPAGVPAPADRAAPPEGHEIVRLRASWLRFAPLTMTGLVVLGVLLGSVVQVTSATDVNLVRTGPARRLVGDLAALSFAQRLLVGIAVALAGYALIALAGYVTVFWRFRLAQHDGGTLRVTRGLLSIRATTIAKTRLRGVEISEPLLLRAARGARCIAITTGLQAGRGAEREGAVLLPPAPREVALLVAERVLGAPASLCSARPRPHGPAARRRRYTRAIGGAAALAVAVDVAAWLRHGPPWMAVASLALGPAALALAADRYRNLGHRIAGRWLMTSTGSLVRRRSVLDVGAIVGWRVRQSWFQRRQGLLTLTAATAAGQQHYSVHDVPVKEGMAIMLTATGDLVAPFLAAPAQAEDAGQ